MLSEEEAENMVKKLDACVEACRALLKAMDYVDEDYCNLRQSVEKFSMTCYDKKRGVEYVIG